MARKYITRSIVSINLTYATKPIDIVIRPFDFVIMGICQCQYRSISKYDPYIVMHLLKYMHRHLYLIDDLSITVYCHTIVIAFSVFRLDTTNDHRSSLSDRLYVA